MPPFKRHWLPTGLWFHLVRCRTRQELKTRHRDTHTQTIKAMRISECVLFLILWDWVLKLGRFQENNHRRSSLWEQSCEGKWSKVHLTFNTQQPSVLTGLEQTEGLGPSISDSTTDRDCLECFKQWMASWRKWPLCLNIWFILYRI